jgi:hypothetical protein
MGRMIAAFHLHAKRVKHGDDILDETSIEFNSTIFAHGRGQTRFDASLFGSLDEEQNTLAR